MEKIELKNYTDKIPYFIYSQLSFGIPKQIFLNTLPNGYGYYLKKVICSYPDVNSGVTGFNSPVYIEFFDMAGFKARQTNKIPVETFSSYCNNLIRYTVPTAPAEYPAGVYSGSLNLNFFYPYNDIININVSCDGTNKPATFDILLTGYFIKRKGNENG